MIGAIATDVTRTPNAAGETALGDLIADAQLADESVVTGGQEPVIAFMNPGGIRADLTFSNSSGEAPGDVTYEEAFNVQPFNNYLVSMSLTGAQIYQLLTEQVTGANADVARCCRSRRASATSSATRVPVDGSVQLNGTPIDKAATYRIVTNNFLADGGDGFPTFKQGTTPFFGGLDIDAFAAYLTENSPYTPGPLDRITK